MILLENGGRERKMLDDKLIRTLLNIENNYRELTKNWNLEALSGVVYSATTDQGFRQNWVLPR